MSKAIKNYVTIVGLVTLILGTVFLISLSVKVLKVSIPLAILNDNISFGQTQFISKDNEIVNDSYEIREKEYYNSEDEFVRNFSRAGRFTKFSLSFFAVIALILNFIMWIGIFIQIVKRFDKKARRRQEIMERVRRM